MPHPLSDLFDIELCTTSDPEPRLVGPWRKPVQRLAEQDIGGRTSVHEAKSERLVATALLNSAVMKASYPRYEEERAALC